MPSDERVPRVGSALNGGSGCRQLASGLVVAFGAILIARSLHLISLAHSSPGSPTLMGAGFEAMLFLVPGLLVVSISCVHVVLATSELTRWSRVMWTCFGFAALACMVMVLVALI